MTLEDLQEVMAIALENVREGISISDATLPDNPLIYVNRGFLTLTGYSYEEVINRNCRFLHSHLPQLPGLNRLRSAIRNGEAVVVEIQNRRKDGSLFWNRLSVTPIFDNEGVLRHFVGIQEDITHQKDKEALSHSLQQQQLIAKVIREAQEEERRHMGEELHDNINQLLATAKLYLTMSGTTLSTQSAIAHAKTFLDSAIAEIRQLSTRMVNGLVQPPSFGEQLESLLESLRPVVPFDLKLHNSIGDQMKLSEDLRLLLYRIVQEQLNNVIKHAGAKTVTVVLKSTATGIMLQVADDGIGFNPEVHHSGIGFHNMRSRLKPLHGRLVLQTAPGEGCRLLVKIPLQPLTPQTMVPSYSNAEA
jgi:PAS domain S-box-containing protein